MAKLHGVMVYLRILDSLEQYRFLAITVSVKFVVIYKMYIKINKIILYLYNYFFLSLKNPSIYFYETICFSTLY